MRILFLCIGIFFLLLVFIGIGGYINHNKLPPKEDLKEITGYIFKSNDKWYFVFQEDVDSNTKDSVEKFLFSLPDKEETLTNFTSGDRVKMWIEEGIADSVPRDINAVYIEKVDD